MQRVLLFLICVIGFVFGIRIIHEPDLWWMLRTGEWITQNGVPKTDPFSFTFFGTDWLNVKWLFEVLVFYWQKWIGVEWITLWQALLNVGVVLLFWKLVKGFGDRHYAAFFWTLLWTFSLWEFRMLNRPEMNSHLLTVTYLLIWLRFNRKRDFWIWLLVPLQVLWTNLHEGYATGIVISGAFAVGLLMEEYRKNKKLFEKSLALPFSVVILSGLATALHPYGFNMLLQPLELFGQLGENTFTTELYGISTSYYWNRREVYIALAALVLVLALFGWKRTWFASVFQSLGWGYFLNLVLFIYLATTAHRNIPFLALVATPLIYLTLRKVLLGVSVKGQKVIQITSLAAGILVYVGITSNFYYKKVNSPDHFGMGVSNWNNPLALSDYLSENKLYGKTFSDYVISSYLLWDQKENFRSYIDFRDLDVFPASFFNKFLRLTEFPVLFLKEQEKQNFEMAILYRLQFRNLHKFFYHDPNWEMVYADKIGAIYVNKKNYPQAEKGTFHTYGPTLRRSSTAALLSKAFWPFSESIYYEGSENLMAAEYFESVSAYALALDYIEKAKSNPDYKREAQLKEGKLYTTMADEATTLQERNRMLSKAIALYSALGKDAEAYFGMGLAYYKMQDAVNAQSVLLQAIALDPEMLDAYSILAECQNLFMRTDNRNAAGYAKKWFEYMLKAHQVAPNDQLTNFKLGVSYCQRNQCEEAIPFLEVLPDALPQLTDQENKVLKQCKRKCL